MLQKTRDENNMNNRPFLKWAGNKYRIINLIQSTLVPGKRLVEPFVGSGALFLNTNYDEYLLCDTNEDLINLYNLLKQDGLEFIKYANYYFRGNHNNPETYYKRRALFNSTKDIRKKSALFIYLNRHCYNGLCRYNSKGGFNVPFGRYKKPYFPKDEMLFFSQKAQKATFKKQGFNASLADTSNGDVVYCDPPYYPLSSSSNFTTYSAGGFKLKEQQELASLAKSVSEQGITVAISNHDTEHTRALYAKASNIKSFHVRRYISCIGKQRTTVEELIATYSKACKT